jgi:GT2 family glycosyltransferase
MGTNCSFRRGALLEVGGFDEEYEYYLEETDLCCRLVDRGWKIAGIEQA